MGLEVGIYYPETIDAWREWLEQNSSDKEAVWVVFYKKGSGIPAISWSHAVDEALCFGWIDSKKIKIDDQRSHHYFSKRKSKGTWSRINKEKVERLLLENRMTASGLICVEEARKNGSWNLLDDVEALVLPEDVRSAFENEQKAFDVYNKSSRSRKKNILLWMTMAKLPETRIKRIRTIIECALQDKWPTHL